MVAQVEVVAANVKFAELVAVGAPKAAPPVVYRNDEAVGIEQSDVRWKGVEDGGLFARL